MSSETAHSRIVLITGGGRGIGLACAEAFARDEYRVAIAERDERGRALAQERLPADRSLVVACDVAAPGDVEAAVDHFGGLSCVINNAADTSGSAPSSRHSRSRSGRALVAPAGSAR